MSTEPEAEQVRVYEVVERYVTTSVGHVRAKSAAEAVALARAGQVEFIHGEPNLLARPRARVLRGEAAQFNDPGPRRLSPDTSVCSCASGRGVRDCPQHAAERHKPPGSATGGEGRG